MRQKIVIRVYMHCQKCRVKALELVVGVSGVDSVAIIGRESNQIEIIGDGIDTVDLVHRLRKKVAYAEIVSVREAKRVEEGERERNLAGGGTTWSTPLLPPPPHYHYSEVTKQPYYDDAGSCTIL